MATFIFPNLLISANSVVFVLLILCSWKKSYAFQGTKSSTDSNDLHHIIHVNALLPSAVCNSSTKVSGLDKKSSLQVVHKHGPCSQLHQGRAKNHLTHAETLFQDEARVRYIQSRLAKNSGSRSDVKETDDANLPARDGSVVGSGDYIVIVGLGTPKKQLSLIFDTGSDITWTQCEPCAGYCYQQQETIFDPSASSTYSNVSCNTALCNSLFSATGNPLGCESSTCVYDIQYGDSSFSIGFFAKERLTLTSTDVFNNFLFGCGQNNQGLFVGAAGMLGLGRDKLALPSQTARKYKKIFSYCLPSSSSSTGFLTFGKGRGSSKSVKFTPLSKSFRDTSFYGLDITGISVGGTKLSISESVFTTAGAIIDSGTVITRLPPAAYAALRSTFRQSMSQYPKAKKFSILDTCYDFRNYKSVTIPKISFFFSGGIELAIPQEGILYSISVSQICLAFAANDDVSDVAIFGNTQQKTLQVVYDGAGGRVGFATGGCQ
ncbi:aspartyl protease family protein At5g10770-like isoform X2 [Durio zibethinus]|uniref:Aspartyl protease family protein At5g10770-like isoform X2 n=1 Tax=Durio zibethinus TaxID=66656 RepID=A0A6P5XWA4_DURZI|nr:aspartyl protease family protein At5g10770-like isoform X2 [Durio zibethinus]